MLSIKIDDREKDRIEQAVDFYEELGYSVEVEELLYGDYIFSDNGITVAFEYKTIEDYIHSLADYRVFNQAINQSNNFDYHFVIIVGTEKEKQEVIKENKRYTGEYVTNKQYYGGFASLVNFSSILQAPNTKTAFLIMERVALKCTDLKPVVKRFKKSKGTPAFRLLNNNVNRVGFITAKNICKTLNLKTVKDVFNVTKEDLISVKGVGVATADKILEQLGNEFNL